MRRPPFLRKNVCLDHFRDIVQAEGVGGEFAVAFSPDQKTLASASLDRMVRLWDVETGKLKQTLEGHTKRVKSIAYSPDGNILASASSDDPDRRYLYSGPADLELEPSRTKTQRRS